LRALIVGSLGPLPGQGQHIAVDPWPESLPPQHHCDAPTNSCLENPAVMGGILRQFGGMQKSMILATRFKILKSNAFFHF
jgi:hypothetical protein